MDPIAPQPGSAQDLAHFVGRHDVTKVATRKLERGTNLLLNDPRRTGKSYWLKHFAAKTAEFIAVTVDYEGVSSREEFLLRTVDALRKHRGVTRNVRSALKGFFENVDTTLSSGPVKINVALGQQSPSKLLFDTLTAVDEHSDRAVLICMDEVPLAIRNIAEAEGAAHADELLQTLRHLRQRLGRIRWILAGSVGFHHVLEACGTTEGAINDLDDLPFGPLTADEARELAHRLFLGIGRTPQDGGIETLVGRSGRFPFIMHKVVDLLEENEKPGPVMPDEVVESFEDFIDDPDHFRSFGHLLTRVEPNYGADAGVAKQILDLACTSGDTWLEVEAIEIEVKSPRFRAILASLASDHYLERRGTRTRWRYPVLQYVWARRRGKVDRP